MPPVPSRVLCRGSCSSQGNVAGVAEAVLWAVRYARQRGTSNVSFDTLVTQEDPAQ
jgi:hypothetical protein